MLERKEQRREAWMTALVFLLVLVVLCSDLSNDISWGDDSAGYLNEAIALVDGRLEEQFRLNVFLHPSPLPKEAGETLVYSMGYPLILSGVYRLAGFDRTGFTSLVWYRLPSVLALAGMAAVLYRFYRRRLSQDVSFGLSVLYCLNPLMLDLVDSLYTECVFLFFAMLSFLMTEAMSSALANGRRGHAALAGFVLGTGLGLGCLIRLNGGMIAAGVAVLQLRDLHRKGFRSAWRSYLLPWAVFVFVLAAGRLLLPKATSNISDFGQLTVPLFIKNIWEYAYALLLWLSNLAGRNRHRVLRVILIGVTGLLFLRGAWKKNREEWPYLVFLVVGIGSLLFLPYNQGIRYCFPMLPFLLLFAGYGADELRGWLQTGKGAPRRAVRISAAVCTFAVMAAVVASALSGNLIRLCRGEDVREEGTATAFSVEAVDMYRYIRENTAPESIIAFKKPRMLYLATERSSFNVEVNDHHMEEADYYLSCDYLNRITHTETLPDFTGTLIPIWNTGGFTLYQVSLGAE